MTSSQPVGQAAFDATQNVVGFLGWECTLQAHIQFFIHQYPQVLLLTGALNLHFAQCESTFGIVKSQIQDLAFLPSETI